MEQNQEWLTTEELAKKFRREASTARRAYCLNGHWMGLVPRKLPNRMLLWSSKEAEALLSGGAE